MRTLEQVGTKPNKHFSTMGHPQRVELVRILTTGPFKYNPLYLARMTDEEIHEVWLIECDYPNPYKENEQ